MSVEATVERVLRLLEQLQRRPSWTADELADTLGVTVRTIRRDVERLRALGYPVKSTAGVGGGYRLGTGGRMPPLLLDDEEAVAAAVALRLACANAISGAGPAGLRALGKLDQVLPPRLRHEVRALLAATDTVATTGADIAPDDLLQLARACRDRVRVEFMYTTGAGESATRTVEPVHMVTTGPRWYLMAWDVDRADWRTFRLDRIADLVLTTWTFAHREHPDPLDFVRHAVAFAPYTLTATVRFRAPADELRGLIPVTVGTVTDDGQDGWSRLNIAADDHEWLAGYIVALGPEAQVVEPPELRAVAGRMATRLAALAAAPPEARQAHEQAGHA